MENKFRRPGNGEVCVQGISGLDENARRYEIGDGVVLFSGSGYCLTLVNMQTGKVRQFVSNSGKLLVDDAEIGYESVRKELKHYGNVDEKLLRYGGLGRYDDFKNGYCALSWTVYPDGAYFADEDGYGMEDNDEEVVYGIINTDFEIVVPFRPMKDVKSVLQEFRKGLK